MGVIIDSSTTLSIHNIRKNKDIDLVIYHPRYYEKTIQDNIYNNLYDKIEFIDPYFYHIKNWSPEKEISLNKEIIYITENKYNDYSYLPFSPDLHYYFYGIKIVDLFYDLKFRAMRKFPKNVADLIITQHRLKITVPKIDKLTDDIVVVHKGVKIHYKKEKYINTVISYLKKFNFYKDNPDYEYMINDEISAITK